MKKLLLIGLLFYSFNGLAQDYSPKNPGSHWTYKMQDGSFEDFITSEKFVHNQVEYFQSVRKYSWGAADTSYFRVNKDGTVYYLDAGSLKESIDVPANPKPSFKWVSADNAWRYEIVEVKTSFKTPNKTFKDCLVIKAEQISDSDKNKLNTYFNYYSKSIGYVGSKVNGELMAYLVKWDLK